MSCAKNPPDTWIQPWTHIVHIKIKRCIQINCILKCPTTTELDFDKDVFPQETAVDEIIFKQDACGSYRRISEPGGMLSTWHRLRFFCVCYCKPKIPSATGRFIVSTTELPGQLFFLHLLAQRTVRTWVWSDYIDCALTDTLKRFLSPETFSGLLGELSDHTKPPHK